ncbi:MAG: hypothetical protein QM626_13525 [Microbacterium sp.]|uniref:cucumopine synthase-related protein n=1 Tax=Microbacterium sp. TaxID=51671 RepID=UPI0039E60305
MSAVSDLIADIDAETRRVWSEEPYEITLVRRSVTLTGAGSEGQYFSVLVHLESFLMLLGPHGIYRILLLSQDPDFGTYELRQAMIGLLKRPFDQFEFLGDLGLASTHRLGIRYLAALETVDRDEFVALTGAFLSYFNRMYQWVHLVFPWWLGDRFPKVAPDATTEIAAAAALWRRDNPGM